MIREFLIINLLFYGVLFGLSWLYYWLTGAPLQF